MLGIDEVGNAVHRAGTVERDHRHDILDTRRLELFDVLGHLRPFKLEDAGCLAARQQIERFLTFGILLIVARHRVKRYFF